MHANLFIILLYSKYDQIIAVSTEVSSFLFISVSTIYMIL